MPIYTNDPYDDGIFPVEPSLHSSIGIGPKVTKAIDAATKDWLDNHPEATTTVEDNSLTNVKLKDGSVNSRTIEDESITTDDIADLAITTPKIANDAVDAFKIASSAADGLRTMSTTQPGVAKVGAGLAMNNGALELSGNGNIASAVTTWLNAHPEATTTVLDNSLDTRKYKDNSITDAKLVQNGGVLELANDINDYIFEVTDDRVDISQIDGITKSQGFSSDVRVSSIGVTENTYFDTYWFITTKELEIYVGNVAVDYFSISYGSDYIGNSTISNGYTLNCTSPIRVRKLEDNLPTEDNKLHIPSGSAVAFTVTTGQTQAVYGIDSTMHVKESFIDEVSYIDDNSIEDAKLVQTGGVLSRVDDISNVIFSTVENLFDSNNVMGAVRTVSSGFALQSFVDYYDSLYKTVRVPIRPNTEYSVIRSNSSYCFVSTSPTYIDKDFLSNLEAPHQYSVTSVDGSGSATPTHFTFTSGADANYLYVCYTITGEDSTIAVYEGSYTDFQTPTVNFYTKSEIDEMSNHAGAVSRVGNDATITNGNATYILRHETNADINVDCYRIYSCKFTDSNDFVWNGSDADGVVRIVGESDFLGGYHGDEITTSMRMFVDGIEVLSGDIDKVDYKELVVYCVSDIYHCNTSAQAGTKAFTRYKVLTFNHDGVRIQNRWIAASELNLELCYFGMLSVFKYRLDGETAMLAGYHTDLQMMLMGNTDSTTPVPNTNEVVMHTIHGDVSIRYLGPAGTTNYGYVYSYNNGNASDRSKAYMGTIYTDGSGVILSEGNEIYGDYLIHI